MVSAHGQMWIRLKRLAISFASVLLTSLLFSVPFAHRPDHNLRAWEQEVCLSGAAIFLCSLPGWLVASPIVLFVSNFKGWRVWALFALGVGIGPLVIFTAALYFQATSPNSGPYAPEAKHLVFLATGVSTTATGLYLLFVRLLSKPRAS